MISDRSPVPASRVPLWLVAAVIIIIAGGAGVTLYFAQQQDAAMRSDLLTTTRVAFLAIETENIPTLTGTTADLNAPAYLVIKDQLARVRTADPDLRFAYLIGQRPDGVYFFFADSEPPSSKDYSPPGQEYAEITGPMISVYATGTTLMEGPVSDRWGTWVSGYVPVTDPKTGRIIAIFGIDIDARNWNWQIARAALLPAVSTLLLLLMLLVFYYIQHRTEQERQRLEVSERALAESEKNFRTFFESISDLIIVSKPDGRILFANPVVTRKLGYSAGELSRLQVTDLYPGNRRQEAEALFAGMVQREQASCTLPLAAKTGTLIPVETRFWSGRWNSTDCIFSTSKDLTAEIEAEQRFELLFRNNPALMALSSLPDLRLSDVNEAFVTTLGYARGEVIGRTLHEIGLFVRPEQEAAVADRLQAEGRIADLEIGMRRKNGTIVEGLYSGEIIVSQGRDYLLTVMTDITGRKRMEERNARLIRELEAVNNELNDFAHIVSHDLKAPLRAIGSLSQWLKSDYKDQLDAEGKSHLDLLVNRVNRMQNLIEGILEYSRVGRSREAKEMVDINSLVKEVIDSLSPPPTIRIIIDTTLPTILFEKTRARQIFSNLIGNAIKYMDKPQGEIHIGCTRDENFWKFSVRDNGPGIEEKYFEKIFQIFQTLHSRDQVESTGIGLSIVKKIVELYGGRIWVESRVSEGSIFYFTIPITNTTDGGNL